VLTLCAASFWAATASANPTEHAAASRFKQLDRDSSGYLEPAELSPVRERLIAASDTDHDGRVTAAEVKKARKRAAQLRGASLLRRLDTNGDGFVDEAEGKALRQFRKLDADGDRRLTAAELTAQKARPGLGLLTPQASNTPEKTRSAASRSAPWRRCDTDGDGRLSPAEFLAGYRLRLPSEGKASAPARGAGGHQPHPQP